MTPYWKECRKRPFNVTGANCCLWRCCKMAVEEYNCPTLLRGITVCCKGSDIKTEVRAWTGCILLFSLSSSLSLALSAGEQPETITDSLKLGAYVHFSPRSRTTSCLPERHADREKELGRTGPPFHSTTALCQWAENRSSVRHTSPCLSESYSEES